MNAHPRNFIFVIAIGAARGFKWLLGTNPSSNLDSDKQ